MKAGYGFTIGRRHAAEQDPELRLCQDFAAVYTDDDITIIAVADGKGGKNSPQAAITAARSNVSTLIAFFRDPATWRIAEKNDFKETALRMLDSSFETLVGSEDFRYEELRATVSAVAVRSNGEFLALSIGDGTIVALDRDLNPSVLIPPYREGPKGRTVYTNDPDGARAHMAAWGGTLTQSNFLAFAVFTDGADYLTRRMADGAGILRMAAACTLFGSGDEYITETISEIAEEHSRDDVALAVVTAETPEAFEAAKAVLLETKAAKDEAAARAAEEEAAKEVPAEKAPAPAEPEVTEAPAADAPAAEEKVPAAPEEELAPPPMPVEEVAANADPTPAQIVVLREIVTGPRSAEDLIANGFIRQGRVLETVLPLIRMGKLRYENGLFYSNED